VGGERPIAVSREFGAEMSIMSLWVQARLVFTLLVPILAVGGWSAAHAQQVEESAADYGISSDVQSDWGHADIEAWLTRLNEIELILQHEKVPEPTLRQALNDVDRIGKAAAIRHGEETARLKPARKELESLGAPPEEGQPQEPEEIAKLRADMNDRMAAKEAKLRAIQLVIARTENLERALVTRASGPSTNRLLVRNPILWKWETWRIAGANWLTLISAVVEAPQAWWQARTKWRQPAIILPIIAGLVAFFLGVLARRWLQRHLGGDESAGQEPSYASQIYVAFKTAIAEMVLPSLALGTIAVTVWLLADQALLLPALAIAICKGGIVYFVITGLSRAVFAPRASAWRILPVTDEGAVILTRRVHVIAVYVALVDILFNISRTLGLLQSPEFDTVTTLFLDSGLAVLLLTLLPSNFWHAEEDEDTSTAVIGISITLGVLLLSVPVLDLIGYSNLASYFLVMLITTVVAIGFVLLLRMAGHQALAQIFRPGSRLRFRLYRWFRLGEATARFLVGLGRLLIDLILFLTLGYGLLRVYGVPDAQLFHWLRTLADGIPIGNFVLSPLDVVLAALVFGAILLATGVLRRWLGEKLRTGTRLDLGVRNAIVSGVGYGGAALAIIIAIATLGLDLSNLALVAGALSVGVGFGLRTVVENFVAGLLLLIERPIKEGDWIVTTSYQGMVKRISVRSTEIETFDRASVIVPNADLVAQPVQNWTHKNRTARIIVPVGVAYGSDVDKVCQILRACAADHPQVQRYPEPTVLFQQFGESSLDFELRCYVKDTDYFLTCKSDLNMAIDKAFREEGIEIPFPQRDLHLRDGPPVRLDVVNDRPAASGSTASAAHGAGAPAPERPEAKAGEAKSAD
jgi:potassium efflux system protein